MAVAFASCPTLDQIDETMEPFRDGGEVTMDGCQWDGFTLLGHAPISEMLASKEPLAAWGVIVGLRFTLTGTYWPDRITEARRDAAVRAALALRPKGHCVMIDVHV